MNVSFNISSPAIQTPSTEGTNQAQQAAKADKTLTIVLTAGEGVQGPGGATAITLSYPLVGPEDIALNEFMQQLQNMDITMLEGMTMTSAAMLLNQQVMQMASDITSGGVGFVEEHAEQLGKMFDEMEKQAAQMENSIYELITNSTYPDFTTFLREMLADAQELRKLASEAKHSLVQADYKNTVAIADQMFKSAEKNYEAAKKEAEASKMAAWGKVASGGLTLLGGAFGAVGGGFAGAQFGAQMGGAMGNIVEGGMGVHGADLQIQAAKFKYEAGEADATAKKFEAAGKMLQEGQSICEELRDIAKSLSDMVLKLYQDFISNQSQIVQRANI